MKYIRRLLWFVATRLVMISVIVALLTLVFYLAMNTANIYLLLNDGMQLRASVIMTRKDAEEMPSFFTDNFLNSDETLAIGLSEQSPYVDYNVKSFTYQMSMEWMWAWPWENTATATIVEKVPKITGSVKSEKKSLVTAGTLSANPPSWYGGRYTVTLKRTDGRWKIDGLKQTQLIIEPTPAPSATPVPAQPQS